MKDLTKVLFIFYLSDGTPNMADEVAEKIAAMAVEEAPAAAASGAVGDAIYTSDLRGSDESGEGTYKVPYKTILQVRYNNVNDLLAILYLWNCQLIYGRKLTCK